jgi:hypothetical protein
MNTQVPGAFNELGKVEYDKKYQIINKEKIHEQKNKKSDCCCGGKYTHTCRARHMKSSKHQNYLKNLLNNHTENMKQIDIILDDIKKFINYLN